MELYKSIFFAYPAQRVLEESKGKSKLHHTQIWYTRKTMRTLTRIEKDLKTDFLKN